MLVGGRRRRTSLALWLLIATRGVLSIVVRMAMMAVMVMHFMSFFMLMLQLHTGQRSNPVDENHTGSQHCLKEPS